jgi:hypothetical protein
MARAHLPLQTQYKFFTKAFSTATKLDGLAVITLDGKTATRYEHFGETNPAFSKHLRTWGEAGTLTLKSHATPKIADRGVACLKQMQNEGTNDIKSTLKLTPRCGMYAGTYSYAMHLMNSSFYRIECQLI